MAVEENENPQLGICNRVDVLIVACFETDVCSESWFGLKTLTQKRSRLLFSPGILCSNTRLGFVEPYCVLTYIEITRVFGSEL
jgi:hypothetical protein